MRKFVAVVLLITLIMGLCGAVTAIEADEDAARVMYTSGGEEKVYCNATIEDDFAENRVMVVLSHEASLKFDTYGAADFSEINCAAVRDMSQASGAKIQAKVAEVKEAAVSRSISLETVDVSGIDTYNQVLCLELKESGKDNVLAVIDELMQRDDVIYAGPDFKLTLCATEPNDYYFVNRDEQIYWVPEKIDLPEAWDITTGSYDVVVGVIDSGIDATHPDLSGRVPLEHSWDFTLGEDYNVLPTDLYGHGTAVAGIIGAIGNNEIGISGVCWNVTLASLCAFNSEGNGWASNVALAIQHAERNDIPILNISAGWSAQEQRYDMTLETVISNYSGLVVCAAGNEGCDLDSSVDLYPAEYNLPNLITVGASNLDDLICGDSNFGQNSVDLFAPGLFIRTTSINTQYRYCVISGTSYAAPYVTGVVALLLAVHPELDADELKQVILESVDEVEELSDKCVSGGRINAYKALVTPEIHGFTYRQYNDLKHARVCAGCSYTVSYATHNWNSAKTKCLTCGYDKNKPSVAP